jgi:hypothetical protein
MDERDQDTRTIGVAAMVAGQTPIQATKTEIDDLFLSDIFSTAVLNSVNSGKESIVDSRNLPNKVKKCMKAIQNKDVSDAGKIKVADFICNKLCDIYRLSFDKRKTIIRELKKVIFEADSMPLPLRLYYLRFRNETVPYPVSVELFHDGVRDKMRTVPYFQILKYILRANLDLRKEEHCDEVLNEFEQLFGNDEVSIYTKMEIADVFLLNNRTERGHEMLDVLRDLEFNLVLNPNDANNAALYQRMLTVYGDSQNVHGSNLNESVLEACVYLMEIEPPNGFDTKKVKAILVEASPEHEEIINTVLERIEIDTSRFKSGDNSFGLYDVFSSLWSYISKHQSCSELYLRLIEEMAAMSKYCTTGHVSRFINSIQGYTDDEKLHVRISDEQQIKAVVGHYLDNIMMNATEDVTDAMIGTDQKVFYDFIVSRMNDRIPQLFEEYGEVQEYIISAVKAYSRWDYWDMLDNTLIWSPKPPPILEVDDECIESEPCQHECVLDGEKITWDGVEIHSWFVENDRHVPEHFVRYNAGWKHEVVVETVVNEIVEAVVETVVNEIVEAVVETVVNEIVEDEAVVETVVNEIVEDEAVVETVVETVVNEIVEAVAVVETVVNEIAVVEDICDDSHKSSWRKRCVLM